MPEICLEWDKTADLTRWVQTISTKITIISVFPTHVYTLNHTNVTVEIKAVDDSNSYKDYQLTLGATELSPMGSSLTRTFAVNALSDGINTITITTADGITGSFIITKESLYRTAAERTFLSYDAGFTKNNIKFDGAAKQQPAFTAPITTIGANKYSASFTKFTKKIGVR